MLQAWPEKTSFDQTILSPFWKPTVSSSSDNTGHEKTLLTGKLLVTEQLIKVSINQVTGSNKKHFFFCEYECINFKCKNPRSGQMSPSEYFKRHTVGFSTLHSFTSLLYMIQQTDWVTDKQYLTVQ